MAVAPPTIWMDVTTSLRNAGQHANGTLRVERELALALKEALGERLQFCRYNPKRRAYASAAFDPVSARQDRAAAKPASFGAIRRDTIFKQFERKLRRWLRARASHAAGAATFAEAKPGDVLLLGGETWSERTDFAALAALRRTAGLKIAAICQDLIPLNEPQFFDSQDFVARYRAYVAWLCRETDCVVVYSQAVKNDLARWTKTLMLPQPAVATVPLGCDVNAAAPSPPLVTPPLIAGDFVITVSTIQSRKNIDLLYRLWRRFADDGIRVPRLVIVGAKGFGSADLLLQIANDPRVSESIVVVHDAGDAALAWLYRHCRFTLYPSFAEGWGLPVSESLAFGKPCLASNATSLPEAGAGLAVHCDPCDFAAWHRTILEWSRDDALIQEMSARIARDYRPVTWRDTAQALAVQLRGMSGRDCS